jgi:hypothetical protein
MIHNVMYDYVTKDQVLSTMPKVLPFDLACICVEYCQTGTGIIPFMNIWFSKNMHAVFDPICAEWNVEMSSSLCSVFGFESLSDVNFGVYELDNFQAHRKMIRRKQAPTQYGPYLSHKIFTGQVDNDSQLVLVDLTSNKHQLFATLHAKFPMCARRILWNICHSYMKYRTPACVCVVEIDDDIFGHAYFIHNFEIAKSIVLQMIRHANKCIVLA